MMRRVIVAGGGTGGHLFPGLAVIEELRRRIPHIEVLFVGTRKGIEARVLPRAGERVEFLDVTPLKGRAPIEVMKSLGRLPVAMGKAVSIVREFAPDLVLGVGGYASGPVLAAAAALRIPSAVLEQNAHVGLTNRMLASIVDRAYVTFPETVDVFGSHKARLVGNPVRRAFVRAARRAHTDPVGFESRSRDILILGGSQGARALNVLVPEALERARVDRRGLRIVHQTGNAMRDEVAATYGDLGLEAEVVPFIDDMARAYADAAVVVARAGATTLAELCAVGRPAILIPFPHAADDHQGVNAEALAAAGAAECIREEALTPGGLADTLKAILDDPERRRRMGEAARLEGKPDAAATIVDDICDWLEQDDVSSGPEVDVGDAELSSDGDEGSEPEGARRAQLRGRRPYVPRHRANRLDPLRGSFRKPVLIDGMAWD